jgi:NAD(P)-dependent dehydrogenase (short-subunit alcohol dehydrogenase family)
LETGQVRNAQSLQLLTDINNPAETSEGLDRTMSLLYYSRIRFATNLIPLLNSGKKIAHVISVYGAGLEGRLFQDDLSLRHHYSFSNARSHIVHMTTMAFERLARKNPNLSFVHVYPGLVVTPAYTDPSHPFWFRAAWGLAGPFVRVILSIPPEKAAKRMLFLASAHFATLNACGANGNAVAVGTNGSVGSGCYAVGEDSDTVKLTKGYDGLRREGFEKIVWDHTQDAFALISSGEPFLG